MKLVIFAGPPTCGKTTVIRQVIKRMIARDLKPSYIKIDVLYADEDETIHKEFGIPTKKIYSGELCPDHCNVVVLDEAVEWAEKVNSDYLFVETAGLCLRCSPYVENSLGVVVLEATSGMNLPRRSSPPRVPQHDLRPPPKRSNPGPSESCLRRRLPSSTSRMQWGSPPARQAIARLLPRSPASLQQELNLCVVSGWSVGVDSRNERHFPLAQMPTQRCPIRRITLTTNPHMSVHANLAPYTQADGVADDGGWTDPEVEERHLAQACQVHQGGIAVGASAADAPG